MHLSLLSWGRCSCRSFLKSFLIFFFRGHRPRFLSLRLLFWCTSFLFESLTWNLLSSLFTGFLCATDRPSKLLIENLLKSLLLLLFLRLQFFSFFILLWKLLSSLFSYLLKSTRRLKFFFRCRFRGFLSRAFLLAGFSFTTTRELGSYVSTHFFFGRCALLDLLSCCLRLLHRLVGCGTEFVCFKILLWSW